MDRADIRIQKIIRGMEDIYWGKKSIHQQVAVLNVYASKKTRPQNISEAKVIEMKEELDKCTIIVRNINTPLSTIHRNINKDI